jgi:hypothetical protein
MAIPINQCAASFYFDAPLPRKKTGTVCTVTGFFFIAEARRSAYLEADAGVALAAGAAGVDAAALTSSVFISFLALACFTCLAVFSVAAVAVGATGLVSFSGVMAAADADALLALAAGAAGVAVAAAGAGLATLAAAAEAALAGALAGVCANALPITKVVATRVAMILFMIFSYSCLGNLFDCFCFS